MLRSLLKTPPPEGRKLTVLATSADHGALQQLGLDRCFQVEVKVPLLSTVEEVKAVCRDKFPTMSEKKLGRFVSGLESSAQQDEDRRSQFAITIKQLLLELERFRSSTTQ